MTDEERKLAVVLVQTQLLLDELAHELPAGRVPADKRNEAADTLQGVARLLRIDTPIVIDRGSSALRRAAAEASSVEARADQALPR